jgi:hypothetical protein
MQLLLESLEESSNTYAFKTCPKLFFSLLSFLLYSQTSTGKGEEPYASTLSRISHFDTMWISKFKEGCQ